MNPKQPIYWHQGLFLQPQHFQQQELFLKDDHSFLNSRISPYSFGVINFELNKESLKNNIIELNFGQFIFNDSTIVDFPKNSVISPRSFDPLEIDQEKPVKLFIGLKKVSSMEKNAVETEDTDSLNDLSARYITTSKKYEVKDLYSDGPEASIEKMTYLLKIFFESEIENLQNYSYFPLAVIEREGEHIFYVNDYIPPLISITSSDKIYKVALNLKEQILSRSRQLEEYKSPGDIKKLTFSSEYFVYLLALRTLNRYLPLLNNILKFEHLHPWNLYIQLCQIAGELSTFSPRVNSLGETRSGQKLIPEYNHEDLMHCFLEVAKLISELLDEIIIGPEHIIFLEKADQSFSAEIPSEAFDTRNHFYLIVKTNENPKEIIEAIKNISKLSSVNTIETLVKRALPGINLNHVKEPPPGLPRRTDSIIFKVDLSSPLFDRVKKEKKICLYYEGVPEDMMCEMIVLRGD